MLFPEEHLDFAGASRHFDESEGAIRHGPSPVPSLRILQPLVDAAAAVARAEAKRQRFGGGAAQGFWLARVDAAASRAIPSLAPLYGSDLAATAAANWILWVVKGNTEAARRAAQVFSASQGRRLNEDEVDAVFEGLSGEGLAVSRAQVSGLAQVVALGESSARVVVDQAADLAGKAGLAFDRAATEVLVTLSEGADLAQSILWAGGLVLLVAVFLKVRR